MPAGRPSEYNLKIANRICEAVATSTDGLKKICRNNPDFPSHETVYQWRYRYKEFADLYAQAKREQADLLVEEITDISDDGSNDYYKDKDGNEKFDSEHVQRSRLRVDSRKWIACKLLPKVYGDKTESKIDLNVKHEETLKDLE